MTETAPDAGGRPIARRRFSTEDQEAFAAFSGDRNPVHVDPVAARRSLPGQCIVHGMHTLIWALGALAGVEGRTAGRIQVRFLKPIFLDEEVRCTWDPERDLLAVTGGETVRATIRLSGRPAAPAGPLPAAPARPAPEDPGFADCAAMEDRPFRFHGDAELAEKLFPAFAGAYGTPLACEIAALSQIVGMECPGLRSLFSALSLDVAPAEEPPRYGVIRSDDRFGLLRIAARGPAARAEIEAFQTPPPPAGRSMAELSGRVAPDAFAGVTALVVGGSRGLGAVTARLLAAGGGTPIVTYNVGADEARALRDEIRAAGGACEIRQLTVGPGATLPEDLPPLDQMYFFATPKIFGKQARGFRQDLADRFADVYVRGFGGLCAGLARTGRPVAVLYPSTVAIDAPLAELAEYAAAKLEGERLCARLNAEGPLTVLAPRLPRIETDQTLTLQPAEAADAVDVLLPLIRKMGAPKGPAAPGT